jgi:hypothetical protein
MAIPLPALDVQPVQTQNPLDQASRLVQLRNLAGQQQVQQQQIQGMQLENQQRQNELAQTKAINDAYLGALSVDPDSGATSIDQNKLSKALATGGHGVAIPGILKSVNDYQTSTANLQKAKGEVQAQTTAAAGNLGFAIQQSHYDPHLTNLMLQEKLADPNLPAPQKQQLQQMLQAIQQDPTKIKQMADGMVAQDPKQQELANARMAAEARGGPAMGYYRSLIDGGATQAEAFKQVSTKPETAGQLEQTAVNLVQKMNAAGMNVDPTKITPAVLQQAVAKGAITKDEQGFLLGYQSFGKSNPTTQVSVSGQEATNKDNLRKADQAYEYVDDDGKLQWAMGNKVPKDAEGVVKIQNLQLRQNSAKNMNLVQDSFNDLANTDLKIFDDARTRAVITTALDPAKAQTAGLLVAGTGGSLTLPSGSGKIIDQFLENNAIPKQYERQAKDFLVHYYAFKDKLSTLQMSIQNDRLGRTMAPIIDAMYGQMPGPNTADSGMAGEQLKVLQKFITHAKDNYPDSYGSYQKSPDWTSKTGNTSTSKGSTYGSQYPLATSPSN